MHRPIDPRGSPSRRATQREAPPTGRQHGFTLPELIAVLVLVGVLAMIALPQLRNALSFRDDAWRDKVVAALQNAHETAVSRRRLLCMTVANAGIAIAMATSNPATGCDTALPSLDGTELLVPGYTGAATAVSPTGPLYFQASGQVSTDGAGVSMSARVITISGRKPIVLNGQTGHVD